MAAAARLPLLASGRRRLSNALCAPTCSPSLGAAPTSLAPPSFPSSSSRSVSATPSTPSTSSDTSSFLSPLATSMLAHVRGPSCLGKPEEAIDVLRTGVAASPSGLDRAALLLAWSDVEAARGAPASGLERAARAADALDEAASSESAPSSSSSSSSSSPSSSSSCPSSLYLRLLIDDARVRTSLSLGSSGTEEAGGCGGGGAGGDGEKARRGSESASGAAEASSSGGEHALRRAARPSPPGLAAAEAAAAAAEAAAAGMRAVRAHADGDSVAARGEAGTVVEALRRMEEEEEGRAGGGQVEEAATAAAAATLASLAASRAAAVHLACEEFPAAIELYSKAAALAERARKGSGENRRLPLPLPLPSPLAAADASLAALSGRAQARALAALPLLPPRDAQADAGDALSSFDAERDRYDLQRPEALAAPLLLVLGQLAAASGQVLVAEGLFRRAGRLLGVPPPPTTTTTTGGASSAAAAAAGAAAVHPSVRSALAWRHAQLLTALPRREREAGELAEAAVRIEAGGPGPGRGCSPETRRSRLEESLGTLDALTGRGKKGKGVVVDAAVRRVLPWLV